MKHVFRKSGSPDMTLDVRRCVPEDFPAIMAVQERIIALIPDKFRYVDTSAEDVLESLKLDICLGAFDGDRLAGFTILLALRDTERNLAHHLGYTPERALRCATNDGTWVDPDYQGYGIQYFFSREKNHIARAMGARELLACTSPVNHACQRSLTKNGYEIIGERELYGGNRRCILRKLVAPEQDTGTREYSAKGESANGIL